MTDRIPFCDKVTKTSTSSILIKLTNWFNILGWPETIRTDGGPQFRSGFDEPESNGLAEAAVKNAKSLLKKCKMTGQNFLRSLSVFRNKPRSDGPSPVQLLFQLPQKTNILLPPWPIPSINTNSALASRAHHIKQHTAAINTRAFSYNCLSLGSRVLVQNAITKQWEQQATVKAIYNNGESYVLELDNGKQCIRGAHSSTPVISTASSAYKSCASPVPAPTSTRSTHPVPASPPVLRRSARLQNRV